MFRRSKLSQAVSTAIATSILAGGAGHAFAQDKTKSLEEITVTGSRIVTRDLTAPSPVVTVGSDKFENSSNLSVESTLNKLPQFSLGSNQFTTSADIQSSAANTPGAATLNLRGLGANRNLVLINGKRAQPSNATLAIDINTIPAAAIDSVEIITGGASAVYGADAMAGVVNFKLKHDFQGISVDYQTGQTQRGDGAENRVSVLVGANANDGRGNVMAGLSWYKRDAVLQRDRQFYVNGWEDPNNASSGFMNPPSYGAGEGFITGGANYPSQATVDSLFPQAPAGTIGHDTQFFFNQDGTVFSQTGGYGYNGPYNCLDCGNFSMIKKLNNGNLTQFTTTGYLSAPMERYSMFMTGDYQFTDHISGFMQATYDHAQVITKGGIPPAVTIWQAPIPRDGRTLPADLNTLLDSRANPNGDWSLYQVMNFSGAINDVHTNNVWQVMLGLKGDLFDGDWTWEAYMSRGQTDIIDENFNLPSLQRYQIMVAAPNWGKTPPGIRDNSYGYNNSGRGYALVCPTGLPIFDNFKVDPSCVTSIDTQMINRSILNQDIVEAYLQGGLGRWFQLPAGEVRFSIGATYRKDEFKFHPGNDGTQAIFDNPVGLFSSSSTGGTVSVREGYFEALVPVVKNDKMGTLNIEGGFRRSNYNTAGGVNTWKALSTWKPRDWISFRGGYQFASRAPNINELYAADTLTVVFMPEEDLCSASTLAKWGNVPSNPDRLKVQALCRSIIGNSTSGFDTQTYNAGTYGTGPDGFTRQVPTFFPLEIAIQQGNPDLSVEEGRTWTLGTVITSPFENDWLQNLTLTLDFYHIALSQTISPLSVTTVYDNCFNYNGVSNPSYDVNNSWCQMIQRNPITGDRAQVDTPFYNLGNTETQGMDISLSWSHDIGPGTFSFNTMINYLDYFKYQTDPTAATANATGTLDQGGMFKYKINTTFGYTWNNLYVGLNWRHLPAVKDSSASTNPNTNVIGAGSYNTFDLNASYNWGHFTFRAGVDNLLDESSPVVGAIPGVDSNTDQTNFNYDPLGRRWFAGVKATF